MSDGPTLTVDQIGDDYVIRFGEHEFQTLVLPPIAVIHCSRLLAPLARLIASKQTHPSSELEPLLSAPVTEFVVKEDVYETLVLMRLRDEHGNQFDFSWDPQGAKRVAQFLMEAAAKIESGHGATKQ